MHTFTHDIIGTSAERFLREARIAAIAREAGGWNLPLWEQELATMRERIKTMRARLVAREPLTLAGIAFAETAFHAVDPAIRCERLAQDGDRLERGATVLRVEAAGEVRWIDARDVLVVEWGPLGPAVQWSESRERMQRARRLRRTCCTKPAAG